MKIEMLDYDFTVCKVKNYTQTDLDAPFCFIGKTDGESSLVCITDKVPANTTYILTKKENFDKAAKALARAGYEIV